jgi:hypothetical protein
VKLQLTLLLLATLFLSACGSTRIGRINADPTRYQNRDVTVEGTVLNSFGALGAGGYQIQDESGKIFVISTRSGVPGKGSRVRVNGRVQSGATILGKTYGNAIREDHHRVLNN